ncbi:MAG: hypothetical protein ACYC9L_02285 [Sulfuricaulis sp.]
MKRHIFAILLLLGNTNVLADSPAVQETNGQAGLVTGDTYNPNGRASNIYDISGGATFPLLTYLGASLTGTYGHSNLAWPIVVTNPSPNSALLTGPPSCTVSSGDLNAGLFVRNSTFGRIGISYGAGRQQSNCSATFLSTGTGTLNTKSYAANAEYYLSTVTLAAARTQTRIESANNLDSDTLTASWYPVNNMRVGLSASGLDLKDTYSFGLEYQPEFLDNSISLLFGYTTQHQTINTHAITVGFSYFFDTHVDLITRDRQYR